MNQVSNLPLRRSIAYLIHAFTASGAIVGLFAINAIYHHQYLLSFWLMGLAIAIDAIDGTLARLAHVKSVTPEMDGALLDNLVDYLNYVLVPSAFILNSTLIDDAWRPVAAAAILLVSAYQFCQTDAKTEDNFFKGFPSYWNIVVFYLFFWQMSQLANIIIISILSILIFVPIKYLYPSRLEHFSPNPRIRAAMTIATMIWGAATLSLIWIYPQSNRILVGLSMGYVILYFFVSLFRTINPLIRRKKG